MLASFGLSYIIHGYWMVGPICVCDIIYHVGFISNGNLVILAFLIPVMLFAIASCSIAHMDRIGRPLRERSHSPQEAP